MLHHYGNASERKSYKTGTLCPIEIYLRGKHVFFVHLFLKKLNKAFFTKFLYTEIGNKNT